MARSMWPPRIIAKDSAEEKKDAPGTTVTVSLPALMRSGSSSPSQRVRADAEDAVLRLEHHLDPGRHVVGDERRHADAEVHVEPVAQLPGDARGDLLAGERHRHPPSAARGRTVRRSIHFSYRSPFTTPLHVDARRVDGVRVDLARRHHLLHLRDGDPRGRRHHRVEVAGGLAVDEVPPGVGLPGVDEREVRAERQLEQVLAPVDDARLLALGDLRPDAGGGVEAADAGAAGADPLGERPLRHELDLELAREVLALELLVLARRTTRPSSGSGGP